MSLARLDRLPDGVDPRAWRRTRRTRRPSAAASTVSSGPQDPDAPEEVPDPGADDEEGSQGSVESTLWMRLLNQFRDDLFVLVWVTVAALVRAMGRTVRSGTTGLRFTFGRAGSELDPGFYPLIPFLQVVRTLPTRSRTLDLPAQRVVNVEGLVYHADANLVYRIVDVRKALIEIDDLLKGMQQMLGLGVQEVLRDADHRQLRETSELDEQLRVNLERRLEPWGVRVEHAGFPSISPSPRTLRITQLAAGTDERRRTLDRLTAADVPPGPGLGLVGTRRMPVVRRRESIRREHGRRRLLRIRAHLKKQGWSSVDLKRAERLLVDGLSARGWARARSR